MRGYTLLEVTVTAVLIGIVAITITGASRFFQPEILALRERSRTTTELKMAVEYLRLDFAGAESANATGTNTLLIKRRQAVAEVEGGWDSGEDSGIEYSLVPIVESTVGWSGKSNSK